MHRLLPYQAERARYREQRAWAKRHHPQPCDCPYCLEPERAHELLARRVAAERKLVGEPPF